MHFWKQMNYQCSTCGHRLRMALEDGCEGPPGGKEIPFLLELPGPGKTTGLMRFTPDGRAIQPVPFTFACGCDGKARKAYKSHVQWHEDELIDVTVPVGAMPSVPCFLYDHAEHPQACGIPVNHWRHPENKDGHS